MIVIKYRLIGVKVQYTTYGEMFMQMGVGYRTQWRHGGDGGGGGGGCLGDPLQHAVQRAVPLVAPGASHHLGAASKQRQITLKQIFSLH